MGDRVVKRNVEMKEKRERGSDSFKVKLFPHTLSVGVGIIGGNLGQTTT